ncbi:hypothetical protein ACEWY4_026373 [Coilia grayii]|uniref:Uncharacterized protein n=1 Tax=Coilia grayii TaxID=363190 RepID=A0ABD1IUP5_9TELE
MGRILLAFFLLLWSRAVRSLILTQTATFTEKVTIDPTEACEGNIDWQVKQDGEYQSVLKCNQEKCIPEPHFQKRFQANGTRLIIDPVLFGDEGLYIFKCENKQDRTVSLHLESHSSTANVAAGGNLSINLCSLHQVKLNFTQRGSSEPETLFIIDHGQAFYHPKATRGIAVTVQNNTAVLSNLVQDGVFTLTDSKTGKNLSEVNITVTTKSDIGDIRCTVSTALNIIVLPAVVCLICVHRQCLNKCWTKCITRMKSWNSEQGEEDEDGDVRIPL